MDKRNQGLTVGELTIAIAILIIILLTWSGLNKNKTEKNTTTSMLSHDFVIREAK